MALSLPLATLTGLQWVVWLALINNVAAALQPGCRGWSPINWWWILGGVRRCSSRPSGRMGIAVLGARMLLSAASKPGTYRRGGVGAPAGLARRAARRRQRCGEPGRRAVDGVLRARAGQQGRQGRRPALGSAGDRHAHAGPPQFGRAGGRPDRALDRRRPLPRRRRSRSATTPPSARARRCCPVRWSARTPTSQPGSGVVGKVKNGPVLEGLARGEVGQGPPSVARPPAAAGAALGGGLRA